MSTGMGGHYEPGYWVPVVKGRGEKVIPALTIRKGPDFCTAYLNRPLFVALGRPSHIKIDVSRDGRKVRIQPDHVGGFVLSSARSVSSKALGDALGMRRGDNFVCQAEVLSRDATGHQPYAIATIPDRR